MNRSFRWMDFCSDIFGFALASATAQGTLADYQRAEKLSAGKFAAPNLRGGCDAALDREDQPVLVPEGWAERNGIHSGGSGAEHQRAGIRSTKLAASLSRATKRDFSATQLPFDSFEFTKDGQVH